MKTEYLDLFDEYFSGTVDERVREDLDKRIANDAGLKEAFQEYRDLRNGIDYSIMKTLKEELQELEASLPEVKIQTQVKPVTKEAPGSSQYLFWKIAAIVMVVAVSAVILFQLEQPTSPHDLFTEHFEPYPNEFVSAKRGDDIAADLLVQSFQAYDNGNYSAAIDGFNKLLAEEEDIMVLFYLGSAQLAQNQTQAAIATFERFLEISTDSVADAKWYLALSYLNVGRIEAAKMLLEELRKDGVYGKDAYRILRELD
jgi:tetratricopeptide (TPR) repeat protein